MIYLDCAATSLQKPVSVRTALVNAMNTMASPGRGGHRPAMLAADAVLECREEISALFNVDDPEKVVFTSNATHALNIAIRTLVKRGDRVVVSGYEHNAVTRPLYAIGADVRVAACPLFDCEAAVNAFAQELPHAKCAICTHISNVFGFILPVERISALCRSHGVPLIVDASQSAGAMNIDFSALSAQYMAMPGHKALLGPQGTGVLICKDSASPLLAGGTGSDSMLQDMPDYLPDRLEAGTHNVAGIAGLRAGVRYVRSRGVATISAYDRHLMTMAAGILGRSNRLHLFSAENPKNQAGVLSLVAKGIDSTLLAERLGDRGIAVRAGLHCAPSAHRSAGTIDGGTVRLSFSVFNTETEVRKASMTLLEIIKKM